VNQYKFQSSTV